ncbi:MAG: LPS-assembly protein LptD [Spirochaetes bacterium]|nr:LPS-assembly protein LptD [Spirochaetota bacterium]
MKIYIYTIIILLVFQFSYVRSEPLHEQRGNDLFIGGESGIAPGDGVVFSGADEGEYIKLADSGEDMLILTGNVKMEFDGKAVYARKIVYNRNTGDVNLTGDLFFDDGKNMIHASKGIFNVKDHAGVLYDAKSVGKPIFFHTKKIRIINKNTYITDNTELSTCDLERPHYHFSVNKVTIYRDKRAIAYNAIYKVGDVPLFYLPVIAHSDDGIGIITQFGQGGRRGAFMQNTVKYTSESGDKWKYKFDIYDKLGYYGGVEYKSNSSDSATHIYFAGTKYQYAEPSGSKWVNKPLPEGENDNWYKVLLNNDYVFNRRNNSNSYSSIKFEWMNNWEFERYYDARREPAESFMMFGFSPPDIPQKEYLNWNYTIGDRGPNHDISFQLARRWYWDRSKPLDEIDNYSTMGRYVPYVDQFPVFKFIYNDSFYLFNNNAGGSNKHKINWYCNFNGDSYKEYSQGDYYSTTYRPSGYLLINTDFIFLKYFTYTPGIQNGFVARWVKGPFNNDETAKESARMAAEKNSYEYVEVSNTLKFGLPKYYLKAAHHCRRSYLEKETVEPFIHERQNNIIGGIFLLPLDETKMSVTTSYDARKKYPFEDERLKDIAVSGRIFLDFNKFFYDSGSVSNRKAGLFYSGIEAINNYLYITKDKKSGYNTFDLKFTTGNFCLPGIERVKNFEIGYNFFHDYRFPFRDTMSFKWSLSIDILKLWRLEIGSGSQADRSYLLYDNNGEKFFDDLKKSLYFYDRDRSDDAVFTLRNFYLNILHDLHCWEIGFFYNLQRKTENWGPESRDRLMYYEHLFFIALTLKAFELEGTQKAQVYPLRQRQESQH